MGKDKLKRFEEMLGFNNVIQPGFYEVFQKDFSLRGKWTSDFFRNSNPVVLELGCGKGEYTIGLAERFPDVNFIGLDIKGARIWKGAKTALEKKLKNVAFIRTSIDLISSLFGENEISEIWLTFSDPQPKKAKKRLTSSNFLNKYSGFLKNNGIVHIKTDSELLFEYSVAIARINLFLINFICRDIYRTENLPEPVIGIQTFYEKQFLSQGKSIYYLEYEVHKQLPYIEPEEFEPG